VTGTPVTGYLIRPAEPSDLDTLAGFEVEIAQVSFGDEAITDPALHRKRIAADRRPVRELPLTGGGRHAAARARD
jgi:hypothetical protein